METIQQHEKGPLETQAHQVIQEMWMNGETEQDTTIDYAAFKFELMESYSKYPVIFTEAEPSDPNWSTQNVYMTDFGPVELSHTSDRKLRLKLN